MQVSNRLPRLRKRNRSGRGSSTPRVVHAAVVFGALHDSPVLRFAMSYRLSGVVVGSPKLKLSLPASKMGIRELPVLLNAVRAAHSTSSMIAFAKPVTFYRLCVGVFGSPEPKFFPRARKMGTF